MTDSNSLPTEIYKETSSLGRLLIKPVDKATAKEMIVKNHYSHKWNDGGFGVYNFGIFRADEPDPVRCTANEKAGPSRLPWEPVLYCFSGSHYQW